MQARHPTFVIARLHLPLGLEQHGSLNYHLKITLWSHLRQHTVEKERNAMFVGIRGRG